ncbi:protein SCO1 [Methylomarinovum tepidoasis]|uniref:Protein SCO1 n=1 Tax=Methylomarinovum tepidoasis TaxID=2840183 RepID=A0AAU9CHG0_9GAMM|nr:SCO family protein [Methylomarinovum sp. IN45]BCX89723.1 protein SCO1 [Methylomarinovum sp. IN45]
MPLKVLVIIAVLLLSACQPKPWRTTDVSGRLPDLDFTLVDTQGQVRHGADFRGKVTLLFTGFTHCPAVCPATLARLATVLETLKADPETVQVLFVSLDPERDTPEALAAYVRRFGPWFVGLTGDRDQLDALTKRYFLGYRKEGEGRDYDVVHSDIILIFDRQGHARLLARSQTPLEDLQADLERLLAE